MDYQKILGENVRSLRIERQLTQEQLAELCNLHRTYIGAIERGDRNVSLNNIVKVAQALNVTPSDLLQFDGKIQMQKEELQT
ncbi:MAG: helix-turn-helix transcriptional regulator [Lachnospiraceae bacterium]|nr:helix-turn-helix transcriptional regulator [Lachnospiraceae bacterium]